MDAEQTTTKPPPGQARRRDVRLIPATELDQLPPLEWLIPGKILRRGLNVIFGSSETCKTLIIIYWALLIAQTHSVVIIVGEGLYGLDQRIKAAADYFDLSRDNLWLWKEPVALMRPAEVIKSFVAAVRLLKPVLVIADTLARCMVGGDESSTRDMGIAVDSCGLISRKLDDCSMALLHQPAFIIFKLKGWQSLQNSSNKSRLVRRHQMSRIG